MTRPGTRDRSLGKLVNSQYDSPSCLPVAQVTSTGLSALRHHYDVTVRLSPSLSPAAAQAQAESESIEVLS